MQRLVLQAFPSYDKLKIRCSGRLQMILLCRLWVPLVFRCIIFLYFFLFMFHTYEHQEPMLGTLQSFPANVNLVRLSF